MIREGAIEKLQWQKVLNGSLTYPNRESSVSKTNHAAEHKKDFAANINKQEKIKMIARVNPIAEARATKSFLLSVTIWTLHEND